MSIEALNELISAREIEHYAFNISTNKKPVIRFSEDAIERAKARLSAPQPGIIYFIKMQRFVKIGYTTNLPARMASLQIGMPDKLTVLLSIPGSFEREKELHRRFAKYRVRGEWFKLSAPIRHWIEASRG